MESLVDKYDRAAPRYTSYPAVPHWQGPPSNHEWLEHLKALCQEGALIDLYLHIPFCEKLCYYCGCHRVISRSKERSRSYVQHVKKEWDHYVQSIGKVKINSLHLGGGTPTFLPADDLDELLKAFTTYKEDSFLGAIEVDPRTCTREHLEVLRAHGFKRLSMGIQDFSPQVQAKINRHQPFELVESLMQQVRELGFESVNFDLIYGLPGQNLETLSETMAQVERLNPDLLAFYSYAHLPAKMPWQRLIKESDLPSPAQKRSLYEGARDLFFKAGFEEIGMDHFAKRDNFLGLAKQAGRLQRNFMGYTDQKAAIMLGLGASAISSTRDYYVQNQKDIDLYQSEVTAKGVPIGHGHILSQPDKINASYIQSLMCSGEVLLDESKTTELRDKHLFELTEMQKDGLLQIDWNSYKVTVSAMGMGFIRTIAMLLDPYMDKGSSNFFSRTV